MQSTIDNPVVLVVEDDPPVRALLNDVLQEEGYEVLAVHNGIAALKVIESIRVDLITLDLDLPGLTGSDLLQIVHQRQIVMPPVVVVTGHTPVSAELRQKVQAVMNKPFDIDDLIQQVLDLLPRQVPKAQARLEEIKHNRGEHAGRAPLNQIGYVRARRRRRAVPGQQGDPYPNTPDQSGGHSRALGADDAGVEP